MKSRFLTDLVVVHVSDDIKRLVYPLEYESELLGRVHVVPADTETDFVSVPRLPVVYLLFGGTYDKAAVIHDDLYRTGCVPRKLADDVFAEAIKVCQQEELAGVPKWRRWLKKGTQAFTRGSMWLGVRVGGAPHYNEREESMAP